MDDRNSIRATRNLPTTTTAAAFAIGLRGALQRGEPEGQGTPGSSHLWDVNGDISEGAYMYTVDFLLEVGIMQDPNRLRQALPPPVRRPVIKELGGK
ncbi:MAG TPA: hypothetical protein VMO00_07630 [Methylomirabilota bacterium]|nr:hypothetical protein [Methylomirabilota bacterium]